MNTLRAWPKSICSSCSLRAETSAVTRTGRSCEDSADAAASRRTILPAARRGQSPGRPGRSRPGACRSNSGNWRSGNSRPVEGSGTQSGPEPRDPPLGTKKHDGRLAAKEVGDPTRRQKSARFVQQAMLTCWQLSTSSPVTGSVNELARPPSLGRLSSSVIRRPRPTSPDAAARPARPPPTITTWGGGGLCPSAIRPAGGSELKERASVIARSAGGGTAWAEIAWRLRLFAGGNGDPAGQYVVITSGDLVEQGPVDPHDRQEHGPPTGLTSGTSSLACS